MARASVVVEVSSAYGLVWGGMSVWVLVTGAVSHLALVCLLGSGCMLAQWHWQVGSVSPSSEPVGL